MIESWRHLADYSPPPAAPVDLAARQLQWLESCIARNKDTRFGAGHDFGAIVSAEGYRQAVPVADYAALAPFIDAMAEGEADVLFAGGAIAFEKTSGSTAGQKLIPYSAESLADFQRAIVPWLSSVARQQRIEHGSAYWSISPAARAPETTAAGVPIGLSDAAYLGETLIPLFLEVSAVPLWIAELTDVRDWQLATLHCLLRRADLVLISVWSPTFLVTLMDVLDARADELARLLREPGEVAGQALEPDAQALARLEQYMRDGRTRALWPQLKLISCWADGPSRPFADALAGRFPEAALQGKGLLMTEGVVTTPDEQDRTVLTPDSGFYEFISRAGSLYLAHELEEGERYEVVMTTAGGLYRYRTSDLVECEGYTSTQLPILRFVGRDAVSDMVGEKLADQFVTQCLAGVAGFAMLVPVQERPGYALVLEPREDAARVVEQVEAALHENPHYAYARELGQLGALRGLPVENALQFYLDSPVHGGSLLGDIKVPSLCLKRGIFDEHVRANPGGLE